MFENLHPAPPDAILGLTAAYKNDQNPNKVNLGVGIYKDASGHTPVLASVKQAEEHLLTNEETKTYLPIDGQPAYAAAARSMLFGDTHEIITNNRAVTAQTPGGTGALRVAADFVATQLPNATVWLSDPTWPNHPNIFQAAGAKTATYPYFDAATNGVAFTQMLEAVRAIPTGDVLLLHGCCHNPTGVDLTHDQWRQIAGIIKERSLLPLIDFAYQGFADGLTEDAAGLRAVADTTAEVMVASSYSKNFGLYNERIGALTLVASTEDAAQSALTHIKKCIRSNYSNPPAHGGAIVSTILDDATLSSQWQSELTQMRERINHMRHLFVETLNEQGVDQDFSFITRQRGMFSYSGLTPQQVQKLRDDYAIYIVGSGRINVAGMTTDNMDYLCKAIADVIR